MNPALLTPGAIMTGDLIGSTRAGADSVDAAMAVLAQACAAAEKWPGGTPSRFSRHRGDGWQAAVTPSGRALRMSLFLIARLRAADVGVATRIGMGVGLIPAGGPLSNALGEPFEMSGRALDRLGRAERLGYGSQGPISLRSAIVALIDERTSRWSREQAEAMTLYLPPDGPQTLAAIGMTLGISTTAAQYRLAGAGYQAISKAVMQWEISFTTAAQDQT